LSETRQAIPQPVNDASAHRLVFDTNTTLFRVITITVVFVPARVKT
jgi:hypothetical protein